MVDRGEGNIRTGEGKGEGLLAWMLEVHWGQGGTADFVV